MVKFSQIMFKPLIAVTMLLFLLIILKIFPALPTLNDVNVKGKNNT